MIIASQWYENSTAVVHEFHCAGTKVSLRWYDCTKTVVRKLVRTEKWLVLFLAPLLFGLACRFPFGPLLTALLRFVTPLLLTLGSGLLFGIGRFVELQMGPHLHLPNRVGAGEDKVERKVEIAALLINSADGFTSVAHDTEVKITEIEPLVGAFVYDACDFADGQFAAHPSAHLCRSFFRNVNLKVCVETNGSDSLCIKQLCQTESDGTGRARQIVRIGIEGKVETKRTLLGGEGSAELLLAPHHAEVAGVANGSEGVELFHHQFLNLKLADDVLRYPPLCGHTVNMETDNQFAPFVQVVDVSVGMDVEALVGCADTDVAEGHPVALSAHLGRQLEGQDEVAECGRKESGNILKYHMTSDG